ncbi:hypothetical protein ATCC90586_000126 [Pythium insidiosum]|nr:hypothetical protein ATCC90586_000126 [Pythium insidiosum]
MATDGIQLALHSAANKDTSKMLKGVGDALAVLPGALGFSGVAFSIAASVFTLFGGSSSAAEDPVLVALKELRNDFNKEIQAIANGLQDVATKISVVITGIEQVLRDISAIPVKVVAEMKLTEISEMKDKFASVQRAALQYAQGNLSRVQMIAKCDDYDVAALFSTLDTIVKDERQLFAARFGAEDRANGNTQAQLLLFYLSVIPPSDTFCVKDRQTDDALYRIAYGERNVGNGDAGGLPVSIIQPEVAENFDRLDERGWVASTQAFYVSKTAFWERLPQLKLVTDLVVIQAQSSKESVEDVSATCRRLGKGYDRDGDAHSKDYKGAPWTIFCVEYATLSLRELADPRQKFLTDMRLQEMNARDAWNASCANAEYVRDIGKVTIPSDVQKKWFVGYTTIKAYAVCLQWTAMAVGSSPSQYVRRVWFDDSAGMRDKPRMERNVGDRNMTLLRVDRSVELV